MAKESLTYLEEKTEVNLSYEEEIINLIFQRAKLKLNDEMEIHFLKEIEPEFNKTFTLTEDQLIITLTPPDTFASFQAIHQQNVQSRWQFAYNILQKIQSHSLDRLKLIISPENIMYDRGLTPYFLHYGVKESLPPYEEDTDRLWLETKAIIAAIADEKYDFKTYLSHYETKDLSSVTKQIMHAASYVELYEIIEDNLKKDQAYEETVFHVPRKKWKFQRYISLALLIFLVPALIYTAYALFFKIPETEAYVASNRSFLQNEYSAVIDQLQKYDHDDMPYVVQYQLASSYIVSESLTEEQRENVQNTITLQSDRKYFLYWIDIGRGNYQEAVDTARLLEDRELIIYGLLKQREDIKTDQSLTGSEREDQLDAIEKEIDEYQEEMEKELEQQKEESDSEQGSTTVEEEAAGGQENGTSTDEKAKEKEESKESAETIKKDTKKEEDSKK